MSFGFGYDKFKKHNPADIRDLMTDEYDYEYAEEFDYVFDDLDDFDDDEF